MLGKDGISFDSDWDFKGSGALNPLAGKNEGTLWAWGRNAEGQLGTGGSTFAVPVQVGGDTDWSQVAGGGFYGLVV